MDSNVSLESTTKQRFAGKKVTSQRTLLLELIRKADGHLSADELYRQAREVGANLSLSTVYRNLRLFKKLNLIDEHHLAQEHHHYEARSSTEHQHLICLGCGRVIEFQSYFTKRMKQVIRRKMGFEITGAEVHFMGYCARCRPQKE